MINIKNLNIQPNALLVQIPKDNSKIHKLKIQLDGDTIFKVVKVGKEAAEYLDAEVGNGVIIEGADRGGLYTFESEEGKERDYLLIQAHEVLFVIKNQTDNKVAKPSQITDYPDPNVVSPALDHVIR